MSFHKKLFIKISVFGVFLLSNLDTLGESLNYVKPLEDSISIVKMYGYIYDTVSENPNRIALSAKIILESLPHGSEIGIISSNDSSGYYEYYINLKTNYKISIQADNHSKYFENLDPLKALNGNEIRRNYYLEPEVKENQVIRLNKLIFEQGKSNITPESFAELNRLANLMIEYAGIEIQLEGHTDYRGSKRLNLELSQQRVDAVKNYLVGRGINARRIKTKAFGGTQPLVKEKSIEASEINRRVEVRILKIE